VAVEKGTNTVILKNFGVFVEWKFTSERVFQQPQAITIPEGTCKACTDIGLLADTCIPAVKS
jgi:hypothetical protein